MKRINSACLFQTIHFVLDPNVDRNIAISKVNSEVLAYEENTSDSIKILSKEILKDSSVVLCVKKKVSGYPIGKYFD